MNTDDPRVVHDLDLLAAELAGDAAPVAVDVAEPPRRGWRRDNYADPRVRHDLELLVSGEVPEPEPGADDPMHDPFVRRFVGVSVHVRRYLPYYAGSVAWALLMFIIVPITQHTDHHVEPAVAVAAEPTAPAADAPASSTTTIAPVPSVAPAPVLAPSTYTPSTAPSTTPTTRFAIQIDDPPPTPASAPTVLTIRSSGYASSTAGTPVEQDPGDGVLPVAATGGQASKRTFIALGGGGTVLHLALADGSVADDQATIDACPITDSGWKADRAQPMPGPAYGTTCAAGTRQADGTWTFDLSSFGDPTQVPGFALTVTPGGTATFQVNFSAATVS